MTIEKKSPAKVQSESQVVNTDAEQRIRQRAYEIYEASGREEGRDEEHWLQAEAELLGDSAKRVAA